MSAPWARVYVSGLDLSNGPELVQRRIALFAKIIAIMAAAFFVLAVAASAEQQDVAVTRIALHWDHFAVIIGTLFIAAVWLICGRGQRSVAVLGACDAAAVIGCGIAWAFLMGPQFADSTFTATLATTSTVLARSIVVPSKSGRTLRLSILAFLPLMARVLVWGAGPVARGALSPSQARPWLVAINHLFWAIAAIAVATITSRILYELRRSVREADELGAYRLEEKLGAGGMGEVWRARHRFLVRSAAVKLIRPELLSRDRRDRAPLMQRFEREACATAGLHSPHTVQLYDFGQADDGTLFYVMELLAGIDLEKLVSRFGPVPAERAIHILEQVCHSLSEAHQNGLTHRDIKPANIVVSCIGTELDFVKVLDFGLVRLQQDRPAGDPIKLTVEEAIAGTPAYTAPEIVLGASYDHRVDIYAVGCVGYWLLTGKLVFEGDTPMQVMLDHARTPPRRPQTRTELPIPPELEQIIMDCLEKDADRRPESAAALRHRLSACDPGKKWTDERAERWWRAHLPDQGQERPVANILLAHEAAAPG